MIDFNLRKMYLSDVFVVSEIERKSFSCPWSVQSFVSALNTPNQEFIVIECDDRVVGYAGLMIADDECEILNIAVDPDYRGRGFGKQLLVQMIGDGAMCGVASYYLEVREGNKIARKMYEEFGFAPIGTRKDYYSSPKEDAIIMELSGDAVSLIDR